MRSLWQDVKFGLRVLWKSPSYMALAAAALALGIGANTAIFSVADAFLYQAVSFPHLDHLALLYETLPQQGITENDVAPGVYEDWKAQNHSFREMAAYEWDTVNLSGNSSLPEQAWGFRVTPNLFGMLGVKPMLGRTFTNDEAVPGHDQEVVLSFRMWQERFGADPAILGKTIRIDSKSTTVIGVMPKNYDYPLPAQLWLPLAMTGAEKQARSNHSLHVLGLLRPGATIEQANAELTMIQQRLVQRYPQTDKGWGARVVEMRTHMSSDMTRQYILLLVVAVGFVLLIACANVANLQFARATRRQREIALRTALGASRWQLVRQLLTESVLVSLVGAVAGLFLAWWSIRLILAYMPATVARYIAGWDKIGLDSRAFLFALGIAVVAGIVAGLVPAIESSRPDMNETLKEGGRSGTSGRARQRLRSVFVVAEIALSLVLLIGAGLLVKGFRALLGINQNFAPKTLLTMTIDLPKSRYGDATKRANFYQQALNRLSTMPGVRLAALATNIPDGNSSFLAGFSIEDRPTPPGEHPLAYWQVVNPEFFRALHISLIKGRLFAQTDGTDSPPVAIISQSLAARYFHGQDPIGRQIKFGNESYDAPWATIVGIVSDVKYQWSDRQIMPALYEPYTQAARSNSYLMVRASGDPNSLVATARERIATIDPDMPIYDVQTLDRRISDSMVGLGYVAVMMAVLGAIALVLACVGVYGVMSFSVAERTHEIGIRMALGAQRGEVLRLVLRHGLLLAGIALAIGLPLSLGLSRLLTGLVYGVSVADPATFGAVSALLLLVAVAACYFPARRAMRVDPVIALRYE
jgi:putative ABC transport system permease protein